MDYARFSFLDSAVCWKLPLISHDTLNINKEADLNYLLKQFKSLLVALTFKFIILDIINALSKYKPGIIYESENVNKNV